MEKLREYLIKYKLCDELNINSTEADFLKYYELLDEYNKKFNLTAITGINDTETKHFIDSLMSAVFIKGNTLDIGAGAGFPSIPLAIVKKDINFTLIDSLKKRVDFLEVVKSQLNLNNITITHMRAEDMDKTVFYKTVVARAVAPLNILCEYCLPRLEIGGTFIAYKGQKTDEEISLAKKAISILGGEITSKIHYNIDESEDSHKELVLIKKVKSCPPLYPRSGNKPRLNPL